MQFFTIGVYHSTEKQFFDKLVKHKIDIFCDIRQRRGVRGPEYTFVNSTKLQEKLEKLGIYYLYVQDLAPTEQVRLIQKHTDEMKGDKQREREQIGPEFAKAYKEKILKDFDFKAFFKVLEDLKAKRIVLFCVEEHAEACHRSLIAHDLEKKYKMKVENL